VADFEIEKAFFEKGYRFIAGVDEVGRGSLFGPVVAVAVILPTEWIERSRPTARILKEASAGRIQKGEGNRERIQKQVNRAVSPKVHSSAAGLPHWLGEVKDSKLLTPKRRRELAKFLRAEAECIGIGISTSVEIDKKNIYWASFEAMRRAVERLSLKPDVVLVDGFEIRGLPCVQKGIRQGDKKSYSVAAASIVAKVLRDRMMERYDRIYAGYSLSKNKGYATKEHYKALETLGPTPLHRKSFNLRQERKLF
jgi:ribonuclease HII